MAKHISRRHIDTVAEKAESIRETLADMVKDAAWDLLKVFGVLVFVHDDVNVLALMSGMVVVMVTLKYTARGCKHISRKAEMRECDTAAWHSFENEMRHMLNERGGL